MTDDDARPAGTPTSDMNPYAAPQETSDESASPPNDEELAMDNMLAQAAALQQQGRNGANWFYWVAALSLVNSAIMHAGGGIHFVVGLGFTLILDSIVTAIAVEAPDSALVVKAIGIGLDLFIAALVAGAGWLAHRRFTAVFIIGMVLYALDGLIFLMVGDLMSVGFHALALWGMYSGLSAFRKLTAFENALRQEAAFAAESAAPA
jgi:hypothetical protein